MTVQAVIFDLDGTLANFNLDVKALRGEVRSYLMHSGIPASQLDVNETIFEMLKKTELFMKNKDKPNHTFEVIRNQTLAIAEKYELEAASSTSLMPGAVEALKELKNLNIKMGVCTTSSEKAASHILNTFKINDYFQVVVPRNKVKHVKPNTEQFELALKTLNARPKDALIVGDSTVDMESAKDLKAIAVGFPSGFSSQEQLTKSGANYIITALTDLPILIKKIEKKD